MRIKMRTAMAGPAISCGAGDEVDVPEAMAKYLIDGGYATAVSPPKVAAPAEGGEETSAEAEAATETATIQPEETATDAPQRGRRGRRG